MTREDHIANVVGAVPDPCRPSVEPVLRAIIHDLNGALSAVTMEAFTVGQLAERLTGDGAAKARRSATEHERLLQTLADAAANLRRATEGASTYLRRLESLANEAGEKSAGGPGAGPQTATQ